MLTGATIHLLENVHQPVSATAIREAVVAKKPLRKFVDVPVEEYIKKEGLYLSLWSSDVRKSSLLLLALDRWLIRLLLRRWFCWPEFLSSTSKRTMDSGWQRPTTRRPMTNDE